MRIIVGSRFTVKLAGAAALAMLLSLGTAAWAQEASSESVNDLRSEVRELQKEIHELKGEVQTVKSEQALVPPPPGVLTRTSTWPRNLRNSSIQTAKDM